MIVIYRQLGYIQTTNIGYDRENLVYIPIEGELAKKYPLFKKEAEGLPGVLSVSRMRNSPTVIQHHTGSISWPGKDPNLSFPFADEIVGYDFVRTLRLQLKEGRDFSRDFPTDSVGFLLNETAVDKIGLKDPIGQTLVWGNHPGKVIGVLKDFHFSSMHTTIDPLIVRHHPGAHRSGQDKRSPCGAGETRQSAESPIPIHLPIFRRRVQQAV
jgi:hypothetical protein